MSQFKKKLSAFTAMLAFVSLSSVSAFAALPTDVIGKTDNMSVTGNNTHLDVNVNGGKGAVGQVDWKDFSVPGEQTVKFGFSGLSQTAINRVLGGNTSEILGKLTSGCINNSCTSYDQTSKVILINPAGVVFGAGSAVDLNSFTVSTFDFTGAKNLKGMTEQELANYQSGVLNKISPISSVNGEGRNYGNIKFDSNYTSQFDAAGINKNSYQGKTFVNLDGTNFDVDKSLAIVSDNISYKDSLLKTADNYNYITSKNNQSFSNTRLVTADGVTFQYLANGYVDGYEVSDDTKSNVSRNISIDNSGLDADQTAIRTGNLHIINKSNADNSDVNITNSVVKGVKLVNKENGDIMIVGSKDVNIANSRLETINTMVTYNNETADTFSQKGGEVYISADDDVNIENSLIKTAGADDNVNGTNAGLVRIYSQGGKAKVENSKVLAAGSIKVDSAKDAEVTGSLLHALNNVGTDTKDVLISGRENVKVHNSVVNATGDVDVLSKNTDNALSGNIIISSDLDANGKNQTLLSAGNKLSVQGKNSKLDNTTTGYKEIKFYNDGTTGLNNVTIANNTTFGPIGADGKVAADVTLETNGDFILDNATMQRAGYKLTFDRVNNNDQNSEIIDDGTASAVNYGFTTTTARVGNLNVTSTKGNVISKNNTNVNAGNNINLTSNEKDVIIGSSDFKAGNDANVTASKGALYITDNSSINAGNDLNAVAYETITFGSQGADNINIDNSVNLTAGQDMLINSKGGDINAEKTTMPTLTYGDRLTFNAANNNNFTSENSLKAVNVDFVAGKSNNISTKNDVQFVNSSLKAPTNNISTTVDGDVIMNNLTIKSATTNAKDTKTTINAKGNVTTADVTKTVNADTNASVHTFPQSVEYNENGTAANTPILDINKTKLVVNTKVEAASPKNNTNGSITLNVKNANNKDAGLELTAENYTWDEQIDANEGPEVHLNAVDNELSVSKIITDKLTLDSNDKMYAADVELTDEQLAGLPEGTASKGYIEVRDKGGFNLDTDPNYNPDDASQSTSGSYTYTGDYVSKDVKVEGGEVTLNDWSDWTLQKSETLPDGTRVDTYVRTRDGQVESMTKTSTETKHTIEFDNNGNPSDFILVYDKTKTEETPGYTFDHTSDLTNIKNPENPGKDLTPDDLIETKTDDCDPLPDIEPSDDDIDSMINQTKLPREQVEVSKTSKVSDNTVDQTSNVMSAAAKIDLGQNDNNREKDSEETEE